MVRFDVCKRTSFIFVYLDCLRFSMILNCFKYVFTYGFLIISNGFVKFFDKFNYRIYNQLLLNILRVISQKYGHNL